jgi:hypothetical protein
MNKIEPGTFVIGMEDKKPWLMEVEKHSQGSITGFLDANRAYAPVRGEFQEDQILAVLTDRPTTGKAYGITIEPFIKTEVNDHWGNVHWFLRMPKAERILFKQALARVAKKLTKLRLMDFVELGSMEMEIRPPQGKYAGMYRYKIKGDVNEDRMILRPKKDSIMDEVIAHEAGHGIWWRKLTKKHHARWLKFFHSFTKTTDYKAEDLERLCTAFIEEGVAIKEFRSQLDDDDSMLFDRCIDHCKSFRVTTEHINILMASGITEPIADMWPDALDDTDFEIALTEYGTKNVEELFAESFAYYVVGKQLPKSIKALMEKTLSTLKS